MDYSPPYHGKNKAIVVICMLPDKIYSAWCTNCERGTSFELFFKRRLSLLDDIYSGGRHFWCIRSQAPVIRRSREGTWRHVVDHVNIPASSPQGLLKTLVSWVSTLTRLRAVSCFFENHGKDSRNAKQESVLAWPWRWAWRTHCHASTLVLNSKFAASSLAQTTNRHQGRAYRSRVVSIESPFDRNQTSVRSKQSFR